MRRLIWMFALLGALTGCQDAFLSPAPGATPTPEPEPEFPEFDEATLVVHSPASASILFVDEDIELDAEILDADGEPLEFDEIIWESSLEDEPIFEGASGDVNLDWGLHEFTVTANLPNGDRLQTVIGGVRVQGEHSGIYAGSMNISVQLEFQGTPINALCAGGLDFTVDMSGESMRGGGGCTVNLVVIEGFDLSYEIDAEVDEDEADGDVGIDIGFFALPIGFDGSFTDVGHFEAVFDGQILTFALEGEIDANRVSPYVDP